MTERDPEVLPFFEGRERFLSLVASVRPELHRYCARMLGSVADAEDVVQDTLARAFYALAGLERMPPLRPWLFRIAHNGAVDRLRSYEHRMAEPLEALSELGSEQAGPEEALAREQATALAISRFSELPPQQRSAVILKDVLGHSVEEIAELLELAVPAVKASLHRGRKRLAALAREAPRADPPRHSSPALLRFVALFNARDWDALRTLLAADVELDLVSRAQRRGQNVSSYFSNYAALSDWHLTPGFVDGHEAILVRRSPGHPNPSYFIELTLEAGKVCFIRDFCFVPYILADAQVERTE
ncbi:MAG TPA: sigma-70 family RNA polymerase sigma factor [Polyangiaceae bacterium]|nr:sigma-70 family RNA polymerase sigma factor [Polyangiaceae bacterium]